MSELFRLKTLLLLFLIFLFSELNPVYAATYGSGNYGSGLYGVGSSTSNSGNSSSSNSSNSSGSSSSGSSPCTKSAPINSPDLFQINTLSTTATIYFAPALKPVSHYLINYGFKENEERYNVTTDATGFVVKALSPNTTYYFKLRAFNDCSPGPWSNTIKVKTAPKGSNKQAIFYKNTFTIINRSLQVTNRGKTLINLPLPIKQQSSSPKINSSYPNTQAQPQNTTTNPISSPQINWFGQVMNSVKKFFGF